MSTKRALSACSRVEGCGEEQAIECGVKPRIQTQRLERVSVKSDTRILMETEDKGVIPERLPGGGEPFKEMMCPVRGEKWGKERAPKPRKLQGQNKRGKNPERQG